MTAIELEPENSSCWNTKAYALDKQDRYEEALKYYDKAIELDPGWSMLWNNRGYNLYKQGKYDYAMKDINKSIVFFEILSTSI